MKIKTLLSEKKTQEHFIYVLLYFIPLPRFQYFCKCISMLDDWAIKLLITIHSESAYVISNLFYIL